MRNLRALSAAVAVGCWLGGTACKPRTDLSAVSSPSAKSSVTPASQGRAPEWRLKGLDGKEISSADFRGKVVVVDFWATWCPPCREEIPGYIKLQEKYGKEGLIVVGVSLDEKGPEHVRKFVEQQGINYPVVMGDSDVAEAFGGVEAIPTTFLIDRAGNIRDQKVGAVKAADYEQRVVAVLKESR